MRLSALLFLLCLLVSLKAQPGYNVNPGFHPNAFWLKASMSGEELIRYTLDGSIPDASSQRWKDSLWISNPSGKSNCFSEVRTTISQEELHYPAWESPGEALEKIHVLRMAAFREGKRTGPVYTRTDVVVPEAFSRYSLPVVSLVTDSLNLFSFDSGIYVPGLHWNSKDPEWSGNYFKTGEDWERDVHISYFSALGERGFSQDAGIRIHGGMTRQASQKTLRLYARNDYGQQYFNAPLFAGRETEQYKRFLLRTTMGSWGDQSIVKDVLVHELARSMEVEIMDYQPVIVYLNGEYWGIHTMRERVDNRYLASLFDVDKDSVDLIGGNWGLVAEGSNEDYIQLAEYIASNDLADHLAYDHVCDRVDIQSFVDYLIVKMYFFDLDWPGNNQKLWKPQAADGKWRWIVSDMDAGFPSRPGNMFDHALGEGEEGDWYHQPVSSFLLKKLLHNEEFTERFISSWLHSLEHEFLPGRAAVLIDSLRGLYETELQRHIGRWNYPDSPGAWKDDLNEGLYEFMLERKAQVIEDLRGYFRDHELLQDLEPAGDPVLLVRPGPNPHPGYFTLYNKSDQSFMAELALFDLNGRLVFRQDYFFLEASGSASMQIPVRASGMYFLRISSQDLSLTVPLVWLN